RPQLHTQQRDCPAANPPSDDLRMTLTRIRPCPTLCPQPDSHGKNYVGARVGRAGDRRITQHLQCTLAERESAMACTSAGCSRIRGGEQRLIRVREPMRGGGRKMRGYAPKFATPP